MRLLIILLTLAIAGNSAAQDRIYLLRGEVIEARVLSAGYNRVSYLTVSGGDTAELKIRSNDVERIVYADGRTWPTSVEHRREIQRRKYRLEHPVPVYQYRGYKNVITANLPFYMNIAGYPGIVLGIGYQRFFGQAGKLSASLSLNKYWAGTGGRGKMVRGEERANIVIAYFMPGIHYHPFGNNKSADLSVGAVFPVGTIRRHDTKYDRSGMVYTPTTHHILAAALGELNMRSHSRSHFVFTATVSAGPMMAAGGTTGWLALLGFKLGGRF